MGNSAPSVERNVSLYVGEQSREHIIGLLEKVQCQLHRSGPIGYGTLSKSDKQLFKLILKGCNLEWPYRSVNSLVESNASFSCSLLEGSTGKQCNPSASQASHLEERKLFVVGVITSQPKVPEVFAQTPLYVDGSLYLTDSTGTVPCVVANGVPYDAINQVVLLTKWKCIVGDKQTLQFLPAAHRALKLPRSLHVEIDSVLTCCVAPVPPSLLVDTLTVKAFGQLSREEIRRAGKAKRLFSISGCVSAASPVIRMRGEERMCFIQLMDQSGDLSCEIVVKEPSLLHLSNTLHLHKEYLLTSLRISMLRIDNKVEPHEMSAAKSTADERRVLCVTASTEVHQCGEQSGHEGSPTEQEEEEVSTSKEQSRKKEGKRQSQAPLSASDFVASLRGAPEDVQRGKRRRTSSLESLPGAAKRKYDGEQLSVSVSEWISKTNICPLSSPVKSSVKDLSVAESSVLSCNSRDSAASKPGELVPHSSDGGPSKGGLTEGGSEDAVGPHVGEHLSAQRQMINYQGTITKVLYQEAGVYELDNHIKLYLSHTPLHGAVHGLREGATVVAYNVHLVEVPLVKMMGLCVCSMSCVRVVQFSSLCPQAGYKPFIPRRLPHLAFSQRVGGPEFAWALDVFQQSRDRLAGLLMELNTAASRDQHCAGLLELIVSELTVKKRDFICEVFSSPHHCHVPRSHHWDPPYRVLYPDGINPALQEMARASGWRDGCGGVAGEGEEGDLPKWAYCKLESGTAKPPLMLVGVVDGHRRRGTIVLRDSQFSLEMAVVPSNKEAKSAPPLEIGQLVAVTNFTALMERLCVQRRCDGDDNAPWVTYHTCVCVNRSDTVILRANEKMQKGGCEQAPEELITGVSPPYCLVLYKSPLALGTGQSAPLLRFTFTAKVRVAEDVEVLKKTPSSKMKHQVKDVTIQFHGTGVKHYSFVLPRCIYRLGHMPGKGKSPSFSELGSCLLFDSEMVLHPVGNSQGAMNFITTGVNLSHIKNLQPLLDWRAPAAGVSEQPQSQMVSFTGTLLSRSYKQDMKKCRALQSVYTGDDDVIEMGAFRGSLEDFDALRVCSVYLTHELELKLADLSSPDVVTVYCCLKSHSQPTWLIPGMRIELRNFLLERSTRYDNVYCKHCPQSVIRPVGLPEWEVEASLSSTSDLRQEMAARCSLPLTNIFTLFQKLTALELKQTAVMVMGSVMHVQHVSFVWICALCQQAVVGGRCRPSCNGPRGSVKVEARCLFSDGSGECMLFCGGKLVKTVLNLSQLDWAGFNQTVAETGQLVYNRPSKFTQKVDLPRHEGPPPQKPEQSAATKPTSAVDILAQKVLHPSVHRPLKVVVQPFLISADLLYPGQPKMRQISLSAQSQLNTLVLPKLQLRALHVEPVNYISEAALILREMKPSQS